MAPPTRSLRRHGVLLATESADPGFGRGGQFATLEGNSDLAAKNFILG